MIGRNRGNLVEKEGERGGGELEKERGEEVLEMLGMKGNEKRG